MFCIVNICNVIIITNDFNFNLTMPIQSSSLIHLIKNNFPLLKTSHIILINVEQKTSNNI